MRKVAQNCIGTKRVSHGQDILLKHEECLSFMKDFLSTKTPVSLKVKVKSNTNESEQLDHPRSLDRAVTVIASGIQELSDSEGSESELESSKYRDDLKAETSDNDMDGRDSGVSDAIWESLKLSKKAVAAFEEAQLKETIKLANEMRMANEELIREERSHDDEQLKKSLHEQMILQNVYEKRRIVMQDIVRVKKALVDEHECKEKERMHEMEQTQKKLKGKCPVGYDWYPFGDGYRCAGGSHYIASIEMM